MSPEKSAQARPLVSVICRSIGRAQLSQALQSISAQTYPNLEIILVDAKGEGLPDVASHCGTVPVLHIGGDQRYRRSQAANAGLEAARGDYLLFLDDDDWIAPAHVQNLVTALEQQPQSRAAYSNTRKTDPEGKPTETVFREAYDPVLLMRDNYIPIHAMLFHRSLLVHNCRFDETFDIYEDWDFWLQLNQHTDFVHVDSITAYYREGGDSETAAADTRSRYQDNNLLGKGRAALFDKWLPRWTGAQLNQLIGSLDKSEQLRDLAAQLHAANESRDTAIRERHKIEAARSQLQDKLDHAALQITDKDKQISNLTQHADNLDQHGRNLERDKLELQSVLQNIHASLSWKLMGPFRRIYRFLQNRTISKREP